MDGLLREFVAEASESLDKVDQELARLVEMPGNEKILQHIFRLLHSIKGTCGFLNLPRFEALVDAAEALMEKLRNGAADNDAAYTLTAAVARMKSLLFAIEKHQAEPDGEDRDIIEALAEALSGKPRVKIHTPANEPDRNFEKYYVRVAKDALQQLAQNVEELAEIRDQLIDLSGAPNGCDFGTPLRHLSGITDQLLKASSAAQKIPFSHALKKLPRLARALSKELGKAIELKIQGAELEFDRELVELIKDPLVHMLRNAADHGIELPSLREAAGKPRTGCITLDIRNERNQVVIEMKDDGCGFDIENLKRAAMRLKISDEMMRDESQIQNLAFTPGLSTASGFTKISGRGVGLDVVRHSVAQLSGSIDLRTEAGEGASLTIRIPLKSETLRERLSFVVFRAGGEQKALPLTLVKRFEKIETAHIARTAQGEMIDYHGEAMPLARLSRKESTGILPALIFSDAGRLKGLVVDEIVGIIEGGAVKPVSGKPGIVATATMRGQPVDVVDVVGILA